MARFVPDIKTNRWVIIAPGRVTRPHDNTATVEIKGKCVFCAGNEHLNPLELFRISSGERHGSSQGSRQGPDWRIRVIANKFPITDLHEVIIHSPDHGCDIDTLPLEQVELLIKTYRQRYNYHVNQGNGQVMIFNNHDVHAGASIKHPHSQVVVVPKQINLDTVPREPVNNLVVDNKFFYLYCPDFSQWPYEIWIAPKIAWKSFGEITDEEISDLGPLLQQTLKTIIKKFSAAHALKQNVLPGDQTNEIPYNFYIYHGADWYLRIIPRLIHRAGFELGTGLSVNIVDPLKAAEEYRQELN